MKIVTRGLCASLGVLGAGMLLAVPASAITQQVVGWQVYTNAGGNNNSGISDATPDSNSTYDATPDGTIGTGNTYLNGVIGPGASAGGRKGRGQQTNKAFLNGPEFGDDTGNGVPIIDLHDLNAKLTKRIIRSIRSTAEDLQTAAAHTALTFATAGHAQRTRLAFYFPMMY